MLTRAGELVTRNRDSLSFSYRKSSLSELVILNAEFEFDREPSEYLTKEMQKLWIVRRASQPAPDQHVAYMFKDHGGDSAGDLIDQVGLKGKKIGQVEINEMDPNFFVAQQGSSSEDVLKMIEMVKSEVASKLDVELETAIQIW